jgi:hypothetical protein
VAAQHDPGLSERSDVPSDIQVSRVVDGRVVPPEIILENHHEMRWGRCTLRREHGGKSDRQEPRHNYPTTSTV